jgi:hypothetical protein
MTRTATSSPGSSNPTSCRMTSTQTASDACAVTAVRSLSVFSSMTTFGRSTSPSEYRHNTPPRGSDTSVVCRECPDSTPNATSTTIAC